MRWINILSTVFTILAIVFLYFSLRIKGDELTYALISLGLWGIAFLLNQYSRKKKAIEEKKETE
jgi:hypothetical protein